MATQFAAQTITITAATLGNTASRESASVNTDTASNVNDYRITVRPTLGSGSLSITRAVFVWVKTSTDSTTWDGNATGADAAITLDNPHQFIQGCVIPFTAVSVARGASFSLKAVCGSLPKTWGIIVENQSGVAFTAFEVDCQREYTT